MYLTQKTTGWYTRQKPFRPTKIDRLIIEIMATQEEVTAIEGDLMVGAGTIKIDAIHPGDQNAGDAITMAMLVQTVHIRTRST